jgi:tRNA modification GTPase
MHFEYLDGTIIACSSNYQGNSAIALIRISGFDSLLPFQPFFRLNLDNINSRYAYYTDLISNNEIIDSIVLTFFNQPATYNGENILELSVHGNILNVEKIIKLFVDNQLARLASPGEFTYRALKNGKMTLSQVEGLDLLLNAKTDFALKQGLSVLSGELQEQYSKLHHDFISLKTTLEMHFDFLEDIGDTQAKNLFNKHLTELTQTISHLELRASVDQGGLLSPEIILVGETNAGKSTLFNRLLNEDRSIISAIRGTTRDFISEPVSLDGTTFKLIDTAGLREFTQDLIETKGIELGLSKLKTSFFKILVINPFDNFTLSKKFLSFDYDLIVFTHTDQPHFLEAKKTFLSSGSIEPLLTKTSPPTILDSLPGSIGAEIKQVVLNKYNLQTLKSPILLERHKACIREITRELNNFKQLVDNCPDMAIISHHLNLIGQTISELIGIVPANDVLDNLFSNFCIGK